MKTRGFTLLIGDGERRSGEFRNEDALERGDGDAALARGRAAGQQPGQDGRRTGRAWPGTAFPALAGVRGQGPVAPRQVENIAEGTAADSVPKSLPAADFGTRPGASAAVSCSTRHHMGLVFRGWSRAGVRVVRWASRGALVMPVSGIASHAGVCCLKKAFMPDSESQEAEPVPPKSGGDAPPTAFVLAHKLDVPRALRPGKRLVGGSPPGLQRGSSAPGGRPRLARPAERGLLRLLAARPELPKGMTAAGNTAVKTSPVDDPSQGAFYCTNGVDPEVHNVHAVQSFDLAWLLT